MFVTHGPVDPSSPLFAGRSAELGQMEAWLVSARCVGALLGARQTGKTSLLLKLRHALAGKYAFVFIDLEAVAGATWEECIGYVAGEIAAQLPDQVGAQAFDIPKQSSQFLHFLQRCARAAAGVRIVVLLDELGALSPESALRLSSTIRAVFTSRHVKPEFRRYVFIVAGATDMLEIATARNSPLRNVAETLYLGDLSPSDTEWLVAEMFRDAPPSPGRSSHQVLHGWTGGHPYWTQRLGELLARDATELSDRTVDQLVEHLLRTEDTNLPYVFRILQADPTLLAFVRALLAGTPISFSRADPMIARLELLGLLKNEDGQCAIRNRIYRRALEVDPVRRKPVPHDVRRVVEPLAAATSVDAVLRVTAEGLQRAFQNTSVAVLTRTTTDAGLTIGFSLGLRRAGDQENRLLRPGNHLAAVLAGPAALSDVDLPQSELDALKRLHAELLVPVRLKGATVAVFVLGGKLSGDRYDDQDREFAAAVSELTGTSIDRIQLRLFEREAERAWQIQLGLLPAKLPIAQGLEIAATCQPARAVGGDYYDAFKLSERLVVFCIGDVVGKGMPAALLMANLQAAVKALSSETTPPGALCDGVNRLIARNLKPGEFITFFYAVVDTATRRLVYTNAGHNPPLLFRGRDEVIRLDQGGSVLGVFPEASYGQFELTLEPGDRLLMFTDGVTEATNREGDEFGEEGVIAAAQPHSDATTLHHAVVDAVTTFCLGDFRDDVTLVAVSSRATE